MTAISIDEHDLKVNEPQHGATEGDVDQRIGPQSQPATELPSAAGVERFSVVVIGGGLTGLAAGYELAQRGIAFIILERGGRLGEDWRPRWDSLRLFTPARFDGLPGLPFRGEERAVTRDQISEYLEEYAERFGLPVRLGIDVLGLSADECGEILVEWENSRLVADQVIVAPDTHPRQLDPSIVRLRAGEYRTLSQLSQAGKAVVVGAGSTRLAPASSGRDAAPRASHCRSR